MALTTERAKSLAEPVDGGALLAEERRGVQTPGCRELASSYSSLKLSAGFSQSVFCWRTSAN